MVDERAPQENIFGFALPAATRGRGRVVATYARPPQPPLSPRIQYSQGPGVNRERRDEIIKFHVSTINSMRAAKGLPALHGTDLDRVVAAAQHTTNPNSESIMQAVISAASAALPQDARKQFLDTLAARGVTEEQYNSALARHGAGLGSLEAAIFAARSVGNGGNASSVDGASSSYSGGNMSGISMTNYTGAGSQFYATGMTYGTFDHLRNYTLPDGSRFNGTNILHAGQDAVTQGISPNNRRFATAIATLDKYDPQGRGTRNRVYPELGRKVEQDAEMRRIAEAYKQAGTDEDRARIKAELHARAQQIKRESEAGRYNAGLPPQAQAAGNAAADVHIDSSIGRLLPNNPEARMHLEDSARSAQQAIFTARPENAARTPAAIQTYEAELRRIAGNDPAKLADANALIAQQRADWAAVVTSNAAVVTSNAAVVASNAKVDDLDSLAAPSAPRTEAPAAGHGAPAQRAEATPTPTGAVVKAEPAKKDEPKKVAATPTGRAAGPV